MTKKKYIEKNQLKLKSYLGIHEDKDLGRFVTVNGFDIPITLFSDEFFIIQEAFSVYLDKLKKEEIND